MDLEIPLTEENIKRIFANPFYCIGEIDPSITIEHKPLITEDIWIKVGVKLISEIGAEEYLKHLLENLKGNYV